MEKIDIAMDKVAALAQGGWLAQRGESPALSFEALIAQLTFSQDQGVPAPASSTQPAAPVASGPELGPVDPVPASTPPIQRLQASLAETGRPLTDFKVAAKDREKLEDVLTQSGYSKDQAREIIERASEDDGSVNLGEMFALLPQYEPLSGPKFVLSQEDKPLLVQLLKDLGCTESEIKKFMNALPGENGDIMVSGLPQLLAKAQARMDAMPEAPSVDPAILKDLLTRLGLGESESAALMAKVTDTQGRTNAKAILALLGAAAQKQETNQIKSLEALVAKLQVDAPADVQPYDAQRLRRQVAEFLEKQAPTPAGLQDKAQAIQAQLAPVAETKASAGPEVISDPLQAGLQTQVKTQTSAQAQAQTPAQPQDQAAQEMGQAVDQAKQAAGQAAEKIGEQTPADRESLARVLAAKAAPIPEVDGGKQGAARQDAGAQEGHSQAQDNSKAGAQAAAAAVQAPGKAQAAQPGQASAQAQAAVEAAGRATEVSQAAQTTQSRGNLPAYVVRQVSQQIAQMVKNGQNQLRLQLRPAELGDLKMELAVKNGVVRLTMVAESVAAKAALDGGLDQLRAQLAQLGLKPERLEVMLSPDAERQLAQQQAQARQDGGGRGNGSRSGSGGGDGDQNVSEIEAPDQSNAESSGRINLFA